MERAELTTLELLIVDIMQNFGLTSDLTKEVICGLERDTERVTFLEKLIPLRTQIMQETPQNQEQMIVDILFEIFLARAYDKS